MYIYLLFKTFFIYKIFKAIITTLLIIYDFHKQNNFYA